MRTASIGVDWGTSNLRCWAFDAQGRVLAEASSAAGISTISDDGFAAELHSLVAEWTDGTVPIVLGGMIGSREGWRETAYLPCPTALDALADAAITVDTGIGPGWIIPGLRCRHHDGTPDVMRGEELQIAGSSVTSGRVLLPGTHSKWARLADGKVTGFRTYMTGEMFAVLSRHSLLSRSIGAAAAELDEAAFLQGIDNALGDPAFTALLFGVRTRGLFGLAEPAALGDYLSGLLIGAEIFSQSHDRKSTVTVIGAPALVHRYRLALLRAGFGNIDAIDGDTAVRNGLYRAGLVLTGRKIA